MNVLQQWIGSAPYFKRRRCATEALFVMMFAGCCATAFDAGNATAATSDAVVL